MFTPDHPRVTAKTEVMKQFPFSLVSVVLLLQLVCFMIPSVSTQKHSPAPVIASS